MFKPRRIWQPCSPDILSSCSRIKRPPFYVILSIHKLVNFSFHFRQQRSDARILTYLRMQQIVLRIKGQNIFSGTDAVGLNPKELKKTTSCRKICSHCATRIIKAAFLSNYIPVTVRSLIVQQPSTRDSQILIVFISHSILHMRAPYLYLSLSLSLSLSHSHSHTHTHTPYHTHTHSLTLSHTHSLTYPLSHSLTHSLSHYLSLSHTYSRFR
jgi:hypothetical protein